jgi:hypothetical protein
LLAGLGSHQLGWMHLVAAGTIRILMPLAIGIAPVSRSEAKSG